MDDKELEKYFGGMVRSNRNRKNLTEEQLAGRAGISVNYLRGIERGEYSISWDIWLRICKILDLSVRDFMQRV